MKPLNVDDLMQCALKARVLIHTKLVLFRFLCDEMKAGQQIQLKMRPVNNRHHANDV